MRRRDRRELDVRSPAVDVLTDTRSSGGLWLGEFVATFGLLMVILGVVRSGRASAAAFAVGGYIAAAYWFTSSTSFANPAVTSADRSPTRSPVSIRSACPRSSSCSSSGAWSRSRSGGTGSHVPAADLIVPHEQSDVA